MPPASGSIQAGNGDSATPAAQPPAPAHDANPPDATVTAAQPAAPGSDPVASGRWLAGQLGLPKSDTLVKRPEDAAAIAGVANFRFLDRDGQARVMQAINGLDNQQLASQLLAKVGEYQVQPNWTPVAMTDAELQHEMAMSQAAGLVIKGLGLGAAKAAPPPIGPAAGSVLGYVGSTFGQAREQMEAELRRRNAIGQHH